MLVLLGSFSYTPYARLTGKFVLHSLCLYYWEVSLTLLMLVLPGSLSYTTGDNFTVESPIHARRYV